jgi:hypothetical protein
VVVRREPRDSLGAVTRLEKKFTSGDIVYVLLLAVTMTLVLVIAANGGFAFGDEVSQTFGYCPEGMTVPENSACE